MLEEFPFSKEARLLYNEAYDIARRAGKPLDSAHIVLAMFTVPCEAQSILYEKRLTCDHILRALQGVGGEPPETIGAIYSLASRIACNLGARHVTSVHLLMSVSRMPSSRAAQVLEKAGLPMYALRTHAMAHLTDPRLRRAASARVAGEMVTLSSIPAVSRVVDNQTKANIVTAPIEPTRVMVTPAVTRRQVSFAEDEPIEFDTEEEMPEQKHAEPASSESIYGLDPDRFPTLTSLGRNLTVEAELGLLDPLVGRGQSLDAVIEILCKRRANNPLLLGDPGVGKTALVEGLASQIVSGSVPMLAGKVIIAISVSDLLAGTAMRGSFSARLKALKEEVLASNRQVILFIDEIHTLIGAGVGDGSLDAANDLKGALARGEFTCIGATTFAEYKRYILNDEALKRRFEVVHIREPSLEEAERILVGIAPKYAEFHKVHFSDDALRAAVRLTDRMITDRSLPAKAVDVLDRAGARARRDGREEVTRDDVVAVLSALVDVPREFLSLSPSERFRDLERTMRGRVFGHDEAIGSIVKVLSQNWMRFGARRPLGSFLMVGPQGSGKRTLAITLAELVFGTSQAFLEIDLADYSESHSLSHLIGSPPGYVGHEEGGLLAETLIRRPFILILWRNADAPDPSISSLLAQILSEGTITDRKGRRIDFRNTVHILTVTDEGGKTVGFGKEERHACKPDMLRSRVSHLVAADLFSAVDQVLYLPALDRNALKKVANKIVQEVVTNFKTDHNIVLDVSDDVVDAIAEQAVRIGGGGSVIEHIVTERILRLATDIVFDSSCRCSSIKVFIRDGSIEVTV